MSAPAGVEDLTELAARCSSRETRISVCIPARNEARTIAGVVRPVVSQLMADRGASHEVVVVDDGSADGTGAIARSAGALVVRRSGQPGKGRAMAAGVGACSGDILVFLDADVTSDPAKFVAALVGPLLADDHLVMVKGSYRRSLAGVADEGGRVTELLARPLLEQLVPEVAFLRQPLAGELGIRRAVVERLELDHGYGVDVGIVIDVARSFGAHSIGEVDLGERTHRNRPLAELAGEAREILAAVFTRAGLETGERHSLDTRVDRSSIPHADRV